MDNTLKNVAILLEDLGGGGAEKVAVMLANALVARGFRVDMVMKNGQGPFLKDLSPSIRQFDMKQAKAWNIPHALFYLMRYLRRERPDVMLSHMEKVSLVAVIAGRLVGYKKIIPCVHTDLETYARLEHSFRRTILKHMVGWIYRLADRVVAVSAGVASSTAAIMGGSHAPPVHVVYNGFDLEALKQGSHERAPIEWLENKTTPIIIACGRLVEQKGYDVLLRAFALVRKKTAARLIILGDGPLRSRLEGLSQALRLQENVLMPGFVPNPAACFARSDLFVLSSRVEGLSNVLIEAMAAGTPVVCTDCPTGPREVLQKGKFGRLVPVDDALALAEAMYVALTSGKNVDTEDELYRRNLENFSLDHMVDGYLQAMKAATTS